MEVSKGIPDDRAGSSGPQNRFTVGGTISRVVLTVLRKAHRVACASFVLVLPVGYYLHDSDSTDLAIGVHGGYGQVASVLRGCSGEALHSESSTFTDVAGSVSMAVPPGRNTPVVIGVRGGYWESDAGFAERVDDNGYGRSEEREISFSYNNPNLSLETKYIGLGIGYLFGDAKHKFSDYKEIGQWGRNIRTSYHVRLGNVDKVYLVASRAENTPLLSGGGIIDIGLGCKVGRSTRCFSGLSAGFYDRAGFIQQTRFGLYRKLDLDLALRIGWAGDEFEGSISGGLIYRFSLAKPAR